MNSGNVLTLVGSLIAYTIFMFVIPGLCLGKYVKEKGLIFRFFLYQCVGSIYITFITLFLAYVKLFNTVTAFLFFVAIPLSFVLIRERKRLVNTGQAFSQTFNELLSGTYGFNLLAKNISNAVHKKVADFRKRYISGNVLEMFVFLGVLVWLVWFYGWYKLHNVGYSHTDEETHLYWIAELINGNVFPVGMYPHGVHTLLAVISVLIGLNVTRVYLVFCILSVIFIYIAAYLLFRKMFSHAYVALAGWVAVALLDVFEITSYFRFQSSFPMEYGLVAVFGMVYAMFSFLKTRDKKDMVLFGLCITWSLMAHFYTTILCAVLCLCFGLVYGWHLFRKKLLLSFVIAGLAGILLAVVPYGVGYVQGYPFERSIAWALGMAGTNQDNDIKENLSEEELREEAEKELLRKELIDDIDEPLQEEIRERFATLEVYLTENYAANRNISATFICIHIAMFVFALYLRFIKKQKGAAYKWLFFTVFWVVGAIMACAYYLNILVLIEVKRMATFLMFFTIPMFGFGMELLGRLAKIILNRRITGLLALAIIVELMVITHTDSVRKERFYEITISEGDMLVSLDLVENKENFTWTMVSPTNDLTVVRYDGYHYEIVDLIDELDEGAEEIYIPTSEIYVLVEEKPNSYVESKRKIDRSDVISPGHVKEISAKLALTDVDFDTVFDELHGADAPYYYQRDIVMSKMYYWMEAMKDVYASHISEYYRDEQVVVYKIEQDPYFLLNLSLDYKSMIEGDGDTK